MDFKAVFAHRLYSLLEIVLHPSAGQLLDGIYFRTLRWTNFIVETVVYMTIRQVVHVDEVLFVMAKMSSTLQGIMDVLQNYLKDSYNKKLFQNKQTWENYCSQLFSLFESIPKLLKFNLNWTLLNGSIQRVQHLLATVDTEKDRVVYNEALLHSYLDESRQMILVDDISLAIHNQLTAFHEESRFDRVTLHKELKAGLDVAFNALTSLLEKPRTTTTPSTSTKTPTAANRIATTKIDPKLPKKISSPRQTQTNKLSPRHSVLSKPSSGSTKLSDKTSKQVSTATVTSMKGRTVSIPTKPFSETKIPRYTNTSTPNTKTTKTTKMTSKSSSSTATAVSVAADSPATIELQLPPTISKLPLRIGSPVHKHISSPTHHRMSSLPFPPTLILPTSFEDRLQPQLHEVYPPMMFPPSPVHPTGTGTTNAGTMQITAMIDAFYLPDQWFAVFAYLHRSLSLESSALSVLSNAHEDMWNPAMTASNNGLSCGEVMIIPMLDQETQRQGGKVSPPYQVIPWQTAAELIGEQFFVYIPGTVASASLAIQYYYQGAIIGEVKQALMKVSSPSPATTTINHDTATAPTGSGMITKATIYKKILLLYDDSDQQIADDIQLVIRSAAFAPPSTSMVPQYELTNNHLLDHYEVKDTQHRQPRSIVQVVPLSWSTVIAQGTQGSPTHRQLFDSCDVMQVYVSGAFFASPLVDQVTDFLLQQTNQRTKKSGWVFCTTAQELQNKGSWKIPLKLQSLMTHLSVVSIPSAVPASEERMQKITYQALQSISKDEFPLYSYVFEHQPKFVPSHESNPERNTEISNCPLDWKTLFPVEDQTIGKVVGVKKKTYYVGFFCEDTACQHEHQLVSEPLTISTTADEFISCRPYLQQMHRFVQAKQSPSTGLSGMPLPCAIPTFTSDVLTSSDIDYIGTVPSIIQEGLEAPLKDSVLQASKQVELQESIHQLRHLVQTCGTTGRPFTAACTGLRRVVNTASSAVQWVCSSCYEARWKELEQTALQATPSAKLSLQHKLKLTQTTSDTIHNKQDHQELQSLLTYLFPAAAYETHPDHLLTIFQREGIYTAKHLLFLDYVWKMEYDYDQVSSVLMQLRPHSNAVKGGNGNGIWTVQQIRQLISWAEKERSVMEDPSVETQLSLCTTLHRHLRQVLETQIASTETVTTALQQQGSLSSRLVLYFPSMKNNSKEKQNDQLVFMQQKYAFLEGHMESF